MIRNEEQRLAYNEYMRNYRRKHYRSTATVYQPLSMEEKEYIRLHSKHDENHITAKDISLYIGCHIRTVHYYRRKFKNENKLSNS